MHLTAPSSHASRHAGPQRAGRAIEDMRAGTRRADRLVRIFPRASVQTSAMKSSSWPACSSNPESRPTERYRRSDLRGRCLHQQALRTRHQGSHGAGQPDSWPFRRGRHHHSSRTVERLSEGGRSDRGSRDRAAKPLSARRSTLLDHLKKLLDRKVGEIDTQIKARHRIGDG